MNKKKQLQDLLAAKRTELEKLFDAAGGAPNAEEHLAAIDAVGAEIKSTEKELAAIDGIEKRTKQFLSNRPAQVRERSLDKPFESLGEQLQAIRLAAVNPGAADNRLIEMAGIGSNEGNPSEGGFPVQGDFSAEIARIAYEQSMLASRCREVTLSANSNNFSMPFIDETSRATGFRWGGVQVYWAAEGNSVTASKPKFGLMEMKLEKLMGLWYATDENLADVAQLSSIATQAFGEEFAWALDEAILFGDGAGKPLGIFTSGAKVTVLKQGGQAAATVVKENIDKMWNAMPAAIRQKAVWVANQDVEVQLEGLYLATGANSGTPVYMAPGGISEQPYGRLKSRPLLLAEQCAALGTLGDFSLLSLAHYLLITKGGLKQDSSMHVQFLTGEQVFRWTRRVNGQPMVKQPTSAAKGATSRSPFVALEARS